MGTNLKHAVSRKLAQQLVDFVAASEGQLKEGERFTRGLELV
jgi:hypothetical protein